MVGPVDVALPLATSAIGFIAKATGLDRRTQRRLQGIRRVQRVQALPWDTEPTAVFSKSWTVYEETPEEVRDSRDDLWDWLHEDAYSSTTQEIYLVIRGSRRWIDGVLYASLYTMPRNRCFVWTIATRSEIPGKAATDKGLELWARLKRVVEDSTGRKDCEFFFQLPPAQRPDWLAKRDDGESRARYIHRFVDLVSAIGANEVECGYVIPDPKRRSTFEIATKLIYQGEGAAALKGRPSLSEALDFAYGTAHFWAFRYGEEETSLDEKLARAAYLHKLKQRAMEGRAEELHLKPIIGV